MKVTNIYSVLLLDTAVVFNYRLLITGAIQNVRMGE